MCQYELIHKIMLYQTPELLNNTNAKLVITYGNNAEIFSINFVDFIKILNKIKTPDMQTDLSQSKICEMRSSYYKNPHHFASRCLITIAHVMMNGSEEYFLADGQHRIEMIKVLVTENKNENILVSFVKVTTAIEFEKLFADINSDSFKYNLNDFSIFNKKMYELLKKKFNHRTYLPDMSSSENVLYTRSQLFELLITKEIMEFIKENQILTDLQKNDSEYMATLIYNFLISKEKEFFSKYNYKNIYLKNPSLFSDDEKISIEAKHCIFMINNNFIDYLFDETVIPIHYYKITPSFNDLMRERIWKKTFGLKRKDQECLIDGCENKLIKNNPASWNCGYIINLQNGGDITINNMKAVCTCCVNNMDQQQLNLDDWNNKFLHNKLIKMYFNTDAEIKCGINKCYNIINKHNFISGEITTSTSKKLVFRPICNSH